MDINGESIYGTRPWHTFGEGPLAEASNPLRSQGFNEKDNYSSSDVRFVVKDNIIYATILRWPETSNFTFRSFAPGEHQQPGVDSVELLGYGPVTFGMSETGLTVGIPETQPNAIAPVFRIRMASK